MQKIPDDLAHRLLFILHAGLCRTRSLALAGRAEQIADLADALENLPSFMNDWQDKHLDMIRFILQDYQTKYPGEAMDFLAHLEKYAPPIRY